MHDTVGTTSPDFPFGLVVLASEEGRCGDGAFRWAQTANNGVLPSNELPNTFAAQGFDAQDPVGDANWPSGPQGAYHTQAVTALIHLLCR
jgi:hypothetical protein